MYVRTYFYYQISFDIIFNIWVVLFWGFCCFILFFVCVFLCSFFSFFFALFNEHILASIYFFSLLFLVLFV